MSLPATPSAKSNAPEFSVSEISNALKRVVESNFSYLRVRGEISGLKIAASGHVYLSLKDDKSVLSGVCWKGVASRLRFRPEDGLEVIVTGKLTTYPGRSNYQIVIESMEPAGEGALMALLEARKKALAAEGLFDENRKLPLPFLPTRIGVITSPTGAVIRDILHRLQDRFPRHVLLWPVLVQGEGAAEQVAAAIEGFNHITQPQQKPDLLIVARGGGSIEDLWPFNEEIVIRAVAQSTIPVISAVGHETDTTLIDYVSDRRAPTPTAAAEMAVPVRADLLYSIREYQQRLDSLTRQKLQQQRQHLTGLGRGLPKPQEILYYAQQSLDNISDKLARSLRQMTMVKRHQLQQAGSGLRVTSIQLSIQQQQQRLVELMERLNRAQKQRITQESSRLKHLTAQLGLLDHQNVLKRGFVIVKTEEGKLLTNSKDVKGESSLRMQFADGEISYPASATPKPRKTAKQPATATQQESLF